MFTKLEYVSYVLSFVDLPWLVVGFVIGLLSYLLILNDGLVVITACVLVLIFDVGLGLIFFNWSLDELPVKLLSNALKLNGGELFLLFFKQFVKFYTLSLSLVYNLSFLIYFNFLLTTYLASSIYSWVNYT